MSLARVAGGVRRVVVAASRPSDVRKLPRGHRNFQQSAADVLLAAADERVALKGHQRP
jgi:hypothetical protein